MTAKLESSHPGEYLLNEFDPNHNRDVITLASGQDLKGGAVLGKLSSGKFAAYDNGASDGSETAAGVLWDDTDATDGDVECVAHVRGPVIVKKPELKWADGQSDSDITAGLADLTAIGIVAR
jgi:Bacteriophage lambda head decoration protein D